MEVREIDVGDAAAVAELSRQLGYPYPAERVRVRISAIGASPNHRLLGAVAEGSGLVGFVHAARYELVFAEPKVSIQSLVVDERFRGAGVGTRLVNAVEAWAREQGLSAVRLSSRVERSEAHSFYLARGFRLDKTSKVFIKEL